jgi:hypothetical protein
MSSHAFLATWPNQSLPVVIERITDVQTFGADMNTSEIPTKARTSWLKSLRNRLEREIRDIYRAPLASERNHHGKVN